MTNDPTEVTLGHYIFLGREPQDVLEGEHPESITQIFTLELEGHTLATLKLSTKMGESPEVAEDRLKTAFQMLNPSLFEDISPAKAPVIMESLRHYGKKYRERVSKGEIRGVCKEIELTDLG